MCTGSFFFYFNCRAKLNPGTRKKSRMILTNFSKAVTSKLTYWQFYCLSVLSYILSLLLVIKKTFLFSRAQLEESRQAMSANRSRGRVLDALMKEKKNGHLPGIFGRLVNSSLYLQVDHKKNIFIRITGWPTQPTQLDKYVYHKKIESRTFSFNFKGDKFF